MGKKQIDISCPCGTGKSLSGCCKPVISGTSNAASAEALMRSRYTAHVLKDEEYLLNSWHQSTRPDALGMDADVKWLRLKIVKSEPSQVEFIATYRSNGKAYKMHEDSRFLFEGGRWFYVDGVVLQD